VIQHSRRVLSEGGEGVVLQQVSLKVDIKPGQLEGTRYVFEGYVAGSSSNLCMLRPLETSPRLPCMLRR
jgi:hypothetical protein